MIGFDRTERYHRVARVALALCAAFFGFLAGVATARDRCPSLPKEIGEIKAELREMRP